MDWNIGSLAFMMFAVTGFYLMVVLLNVTNVFYLQPWVPMWVWSLVGVVFVFASLIIIVGINGGLTLKNTR